MFGFGWFAFGSRGGLDSRRPSADIVIGFGFLFDNDLGFVDLGLTDRLAQSFDAGPKRSCLMMPFQQVNELVFGFLHIINTDSIGERKRFISK